MRREEVVGAIYQKGYVIGERNKHTEISVFTNQLLLSKVSVPMNHMKPYHRYLSYLLATKFY